MRWMVQHFSGNCSNNSCVRLAVGVAGPLSEQLHLVTGHLVELLKQNVRGCRMQSDEKAQMTAVVKSTDQTV